MSTSESYYTPIRNVFSEEIKTSLIEHFWKYEKYHQDHKEVPTFNDVKRYWYKDDNIKELCARKKYSSYETVVENIKLILSESKNFEVLKSGSMRSDLVSVFIESVDLECSKELLSNQIKEFKIKISNHDGYTVSETVDSQNWARFHMAETNNKIAENSDHITKMAQEYGSTSWCFLHTAGSGVTIAKHTDPYRKATITFPLEPELEIYRNLSYYKSYDDQEPVCVVDYNKINSCVLLNNKEIHSIADGDPSLSNRTTLCFQISYFDKTYFEVKEMLDKRGLIL